MTALRTVLDAIEARITAVDPTVVFAFGARRLAEKTNPPRVVWVPVPGTYDAAEKQNDNPRSLATRVDVVEAHCWAADDASAELLRDSVHAAGYNVAYDFDPLSHRWGDDEDTWLSEGALTVLTFQIRVQVGDVTRPTTKITGIVPDTSDAVPGDGFLNCGET